MKLEPEPHRLDYALKHQGPMTEAIRALDVAEIRRIVDGVPKLSFTIGGYYAIVTLGAPILPPVDDPKTIEQRFGQLAGMDFAGTAEAAGVVTIRGTYRGRADSSLRPHVFRMPNGETAVLSDMDILAWRKS